MTPRTYDGAPSIENALGATNALQQLILAAYPLGSNSIELPNLSDNQWSGILESARQEDFSSLLYASLQHLSYLDRVPLSIVQALQTSFWQTNVQARLLLDEFVALAPEFERERIPTVLLKGGALGPTLYPWEGTRPMADIDVLIHQTDEARVGELLACRGFQSGGDEGYRQPYLGQRLYYRRVGRQLFWLEMHRHVVDLPYYNQRIPIEWFWERTQTRELFGTPVRIFSPTAQLLHLCAHLAIHHGGEGLLWLYDLALLLSRHAGEIDWRDMFEATQAFELTLAVRQVLARVRETWGVDIPQDARQRLDGVRVSFKERMAFTAMAARQSAAGPLWDALFAPDLRTNLRYWVQALLPPREIIRRRYRVKRDWLLPFYYLVRIAAGIGKFTRSGVRAILTPHGARAG